MESKINAFMDLVKKRNNHEPEFLQAVQEVAETVIPYIADKEISYLVNTQFLTSGTMARCHW